MRKKNRRNWRRQPAPLTTCITVSAEECQDNSERMVRKFIKKVKKEGIIDELRDRRHFKKPTEKRREKKRNTKRLIQKENKRREQLFNFSANRKVGRR